MMFQKTLLLLIVARVSSYTASYNNYNAPVREWATETQAYQPDYVGHYGGKYQPGPWTGSFSRTLDTADGFQQGKSSRWTGSSPTAAYSPYVQPMWNGAGREYYPTSEYNYDNMYAAQGQGYRSNNNGYRFYDDNNYNARYATPYSQSNRQGNYAYGVSSQYSGANYRSNNNYSNQGRSYNYDSRRTENGKKVDRWTGSSPSNSNSRYLYDYAGRYYSMDGYEDAYRAEMAYQQGPYNNGYARRGEDYRYNDRNYQGYKASSMDGRGPYNQWTSSSNYSSRNYDRNQAYGDRNQGYYREGGFDSRDAYYGNNYGRYGFDRSAYRANEQMNSFQNSVYGSGRQGQSWKSPLSPDDMASRKTTDDWSSASR